MKKEQIIITPGEDTLEISRSSFNESISKYKDYKRIGINLSKTPYLNSESIGVIAYNYVVMHDLGTEIYLINPSAKTLKVLQDTGLHRVIKIEYT